MSTSEFEVPDAEVGKLDSGKFAKDDRVRNVPVWIDGVRCAESGTVIDVLSDRVLTVHWDSDPEGKGVKVSTKTVVKVES